MTQTPEDVMRAHQYLYYVLARPVLTDYEYDRFCRDAGLFGGGGSDRASDYSEHVIKIANQLLRL
jgi:hypothetical protein